MKQFFDPEINISIFDREEIVTNSARLDGLSDENMGQNGIYKAVAMEKILKANDVINFTF